MGWMWVGRRGGESYRSSAPVIPSFSMSVGEVTSQHGGEAKAAHVGASEDEEAKWYTGTNISCHRVLA